MKRKKIRGQELVTTQTNQELIEDGDGRTVYYLTELAVHNMGTGNIHIIVNSGDEIVILPNEVMACGEMKVYSLVICEMNSSIRYMGIEN